MSLLIWHYDWWHLHMSLITEAKNFTILWYVKFNWRWLSLTWHRHWSLVEDLWSFESISSCMTSSSCTKRCLCHVCALSPLNMHGWLSCKEMFFCNLLNDCFCKRFRSLWVQVLRGCWQAAFARSRIVLNPWWFLDIFRAIDAWGIRQWV